MPFTPAGAAMGGNRFFVIRDNELMERANGVWINHGWPATQITQRSGPTGALAGQTLFMVAYNPLFGTDVLCQYDLLTSPHWLHRGVPPGTGCGSATSEVMYGNRVYLVGTDSTLREFMFWPGGSKWHNFGQPHGSLRQSQPCVLTDGKLFWTNQYGDLVEMWWQTATSTWQYHNHGPPAAGVKAVGVGAPMPQTNKVFVICNDGTLRQRYWNSAQQQWWWFNHGKPPGGQADTLPMTIAEGKLHINCSTSSTSVTSGKKLCELHWNGSSWVWHDHGQPGPQLQSNTATDTVSQKSYVVGTNGEYFERYWAGPGWMWSSHGIP